LIDVLNRMKDVHGRKAVLLISTGLDTFSHATFDDVLRAVQQSATPVYCIALGESARSLIGTTGPYRRSIGSEQESSARGWLRSRAGKHTGETRLVTCQQFMTTSWSIFV
jgi:hypothetical protein